jgi:hypothetical protein
MTAEAAAIAGNANGAWHRAARCFFLAQAEIHDDEGDRLMTRRMAMIDDPDDPDQLPERARNFILRSGGAQDIGSLVRSPKSLWDLEFEALTAQPKPPRRTAE